MPRCCGTVFHREACPTGELSSGPGGTPGPGVPEERQGGGFPGEGEAGAAVYTRKKERRGMEAQVLGHLERRPLLVEAQGPGLRGVGGGRRPEGGHREALEEDGGEGGHGRKHSLGPAAQEGLA